MDLDKMIHFGQVVGKAYDVPPEQLANSAGQAITVALGAASTTYTVITPVYANDLATDMRPERGTSRVSIRLVVQNTATGDAVIAIRGTDGIHEWVQDARFLLVPCPVLAGAGSTEDGFTSMYRSSPLRPRRARPPSWRLSSGWPGRRLCDRSRSAGTVWRRARHAPGARRRRQHELHGPGCLYVCQSAHGRSFLRQHLQPSRSAHVPNRQPVGPRSQAPLAAALR
jgi:hypothetical protein